MAATKSKRPKTKRPPKGAVRVSKKEADAAWSMQRRWNCLQMANTMGMGPDYIKVGAAADYFVKWVETGMLGRAPGLKLVTPREGTEPPQASPHIA